MEQNEKPPRLFTVKAFVEAHPWCRAGGLRSQIFHEDENGLKEFGAIIRMGRKVLVDADRYLKWVYQQNMNQNSGCEVEGFKP